MRFATLKVFYGFYKTAHHQTVYSFVFTQSVTHSLESCSYIIYLLLILNLLLLVIGSLIYLTINYSNHRFIDLVTFLTILPSTFSS